MIVLKARATAGFKEVDNFYTTTTEFNRSKTMSRLETTRSETSKSLLQKAGSDPQSEAWFRLFVIYEPLISGWVLRSGINQSEVADVTQEVLKAVSTDLRKFEHNGNIGAFRNWLKKITINRCRRHWDAQKRKVNLEDNENRESGISVLEQLEDPRSELTALWELEHDRYTAERILQLVKKDFGPTTIEIFTRNVLHEEPAQVIAHDLDIPVARVYKAKFRVTTRLQQEAIKLVENAQSQPNRSADLPASDKENSTAENPDEPN